ncbi:MAG: hypothetical protein ACOYMN_21105 [Roseimicrobium sp.]
MAKKREHPPSNPTPNPPQEAEPAPLASAAPAPVFTKEPTAPSSPFYGCIILVMVVTTFSSIVLWTLYSGWQQSSEIDTFTVRQAEPIALEVTDALKATVKTKLGAFASVAVNGKPVTLTLTVEDLNATLALAGEASVADYRGMVRFTGLDAAAKVLRADIRWKMNNLPFIQAPERFLVGQATFKPVVENGALELHIDTLVVPGKTVSEGFLRQLRNWPWLNLAKLKPEVSQPLSKVTQFEFSDNGVLFTLHCGRPPFQ